MPSTHSHTQKTPRSAIILLHFHKSTKHKKRSLFGFFCLFGCLLFFWGGGCDLRWHFSVSMMVVYLISLRKIGVAEVGMMTGQKIKRWHEDQAYNLAEWTRKQPIHKEEKFGKWIFLKQESCQTECELCKNAITAAFALMFGTIHLGGTLSYPGFAFFAASQSCFNKFLKRCFVFPSSIIKILFFSSGAAMRDLI